MLLLYPGELYRLMGASSLEFEVTCTLEKSLQLSPEDHALAPRHSDEEMRTFRSASANLNLKSPVSPSNIENTTPCLPTDSNPSAPPSEAQVADIRRNVCESKVCVVEDMDIEDDSKSFFAIHSEIVNINCQPSSDDRNEIQG
jgi:hypothetical protein